MTLVIAYVAFELANQARKIGAFIKPASPADLFADTIGIATIAIPALVLLGVLRKKEWGRILALAWFGLELLLGASLTIVALAAGKTSGIDIKLLVEYAFQAFVLLYLSSAKSFFAKASDINP